MSLALDPTLKALTGCGCCQGISVSTPVLILNRPGLSAIAYRVGTHSRFKDSLLARLSSAEHPALHAFTARQDNDFTIALLDAWSTVADVLTFYQERIANEAFLRTATERLSVLEMARLIGYRLDPGVAASVDLAIEIDSTSGAFGQALATASSVQAPPQAAPPITVEAGLKVQSIPGPDEDPQTFETVEAIEARAEWNALKPRQAQLHLPEENDTFLYLKGVTTNLQEGSAIVIVGLERLDNPTNDNWDFRRIAKVEPDNDAGRTKITFERALGSALPPSLPPAKSPKVYALRLRAALFGHNAPAWNALPIALRVGEINPSTFTLEPGAFAGDEFKWAEAPFAEVTGGNSTTIALDAVYSQIAVGGWLVLDKPAVVLPPWSPPPEDLSAFEELEEKYTELYLVKSVAEESLTRFNISGKAAKLEIEGENIHKFSPRSTSVFAQSEELELAETPIKDPVEGNEIELEGRFDELPPNRMLLLKGKRIRLQIQPEAESLTLISENDPSESASLAPGDELIVLGPAVPVEGAPGEQTWRLEDAGGFQGTLTVDDDLVELVAASKDDDDVVETVVLQEVATVDKTHSKIILSENLKNVYDRTTVLIFGNVAPATHGETVEEILGSGDATQEFQRFTLKQPPLTYVSAATPSGSQSTLEVRVSDVLWEEVPSFYGRSPEDRIYVTQLDDDGNTTVIFGDGTQGARLPTGQANVTAKYRKGVGLGGLVNPGQLSQLMTRPLGVKSVVNPLASAGAEDADTLDEARRNAPTTVLTLDRIVSLQDYEDFARSYAGVDKALATWVWMGESRGVFLTIAGPDGAEISQESATYENLLAAIATYGDANVKLVVHSYRQRLFRVKGTIKLDADRLVETVQPQIEQKLREHFSFDAREFGQPVALSEVIAVIHEVEGVSWVDIDALHRSDETPVWSAILAAEFPQPGTEELLAAELLTLDPAPLELEVSLS
ncbi:MAG: putative baseplate assembly protein [Verrucomicrobiales bacterium]|nr:putative baseplate assembly protein [Verrucomicrobiales bacterium]